MLRLSLALAIVATSLSHLPFDELFLSVTKRDNEQHQKLQIPRTAAQRRALAFALVRRFDKLDSGDKKTLVKLGDDAFPAVLQGFLRAAKASSNDSSLSLTLYEKSEDLGEILTEVATSKSRTPELIAALSRTEDVGAASKFILQALKDHGDPAATIRYFIREAKKPESNALIKQAAQEYLVRSSDPIAVAFVIKQLKSPTADAAFKQLAYCHIVSTGGAEGLRVVLAVRHKRQLLPSLETRLNDGLLRPGYSRAPTKVLHIRKSIDGKTWGLIQSGILGSEGDLWFAERVKGKWVHPLFTGVSLRGYSHWVHPRQPEPKIAGYTAKQLESGDWLDVLIRNKEIRKDTSGCGVTDLEKKRLGLDISTKDTDGDGDKDDVDPWPNATQRPLSDTEQVIAAVFEARYHFEESPEPALFFAPWEMKPFEMVGRTGVTIWVPFVEGDHGWELPLEKCYEQGVAFISIGSADPNGDATSPTDVIKWNAARTEAKLSILTYHGGLDGDGYIATVRKFKNTWVVVSLELGSIS